MHVCMGRKCNQNSLNCQCTLAKLPQLSFAKNICVQIKNKYCGLNVLSYSIVIWSQNSCKCILNFRQQPLWIITKIVLAIFVFVFFSAGIFMHMNFLFPLFCHFLFMSPAKVMVKLDISYVQFSCCLLNLSSCFMWIYCDNNIGRNIEFISNKMK